MKRILPFLFFLLGSIISLAQSDIIISQYIETNSGSTPKGIEIFNVSGSDITFSPTNNLQVYQGTNGSACSNLTGINITSGTLLADEVWVIGTVDLIAFTIANGSNYSGTTTYAFSFNGDDALSIYLGGTIQDMFGTCGSDPGSSWSGGGVTTKNNNLQIKDAICDGDITGWTDPSVRFNQIADGSTMTDFGDAPASCSVGCSHTITSFTPTSGPTNTVVTISGTGFTAGSTVTFNGITATTTYINATTLTATVPPGATTGLITVTESGCDVDSASNFTVTACTPTQTITSFAPTSGPEQSQITINGTGFTGSSTVEFNGLAATIISQTSTEIVAEVPTGTQTGAITVTESGCPLDSATDFTIISGDCSGGGGGIPAGFTDLMFSGIYDDQTESCHYFELLNPTSTAIDLSDYTVGLDNNFTLGSAAPTTGFSGGTLALTGTLAAETTLMIRLSSSGACTSCPSVTPDLSFINGGINDNDRLVLVKDYGTGSATAQDVWQNHTTPGLGYNVGYVFTRDNSAIAPSSTFSLADWVHDGNEDCFGFAINITPSPTIDVQPLDIDNCDSANVNIAVSAGGGGSLTYQWKYNNGGSGWADVTSAAFSPGIVSGETTTDLSITGFNLDGYQFYCEVTEAGVCTIGTDAIQIEMTNTTWDGLNWSNGFPDLSTMVILDHSYDTSVNGSFQACSLIINSTGTTPENRLTVSDNTYVVIENSITVDGELFVESKGALVQNNNDSFFNLSSNGESLVNKMTTPLNSVHEYTYWSSPVTDATIQDALAFSNPYRRYSFNAANYLDVLTEINNTNTFTSGSDGIDDDGNDWYFVSGSTVMTPGMGYISMHNSLGFTPGLQYTYTFNGAFNNGIITSPIVYNGANGDEDWNLIGNPYPSAIDANAFLTANSSTIQGVIYLWSHNTPANANASGNESENFSNSDYAIITQGSGNTAGGDMIIPNDYIPSGQSFFVQGIANGNVTFDNSFRMGDTSSNSQFFRANNNTLANKIWINLTSDTGVFHQILVAYVNGATNGKDSMAYDANRTLYDENKAEIYTLIPNDTDKFAVQGKAPESLTTDEVIPIGFDAKTNNPTIYTLSIAQLQGEFFDNNTVYLIDYLNNTIHDLSASDYSFTSIAGTFNNRFEVVFNTSSLSTIDYTINANDLSIVELTDNQVKFSVSNNSTIKSIKIFDVLGKEIYSFMGNSNTEILNLEKLQQSLYFAQVKLSNGAEITKKAVKK